MSSTVQIEIRTNAVALSKDYHNTAVLNTRHTGDDEHLAGNQTAVQDATEDQTPPLAPLVEEGKTKSETQEESTI